MPFIVCIEIIRNLIRPGNLGVRLSSSRPVTAGHLLLTLLRNNGPSLNYQLFSVLIAAQIRPIISESVVLTNSVILVH